MSYIGTLCGIHWHLLFLRLELFDRNGLSKDCTENFLHFVLCMSFKCVSNQGCNFLLRCQCLATKPFRSSAVPDGESISLMMPGEFFF
jgi:hypothetical protein